MSYAPINLLNITLAIITLATGVFILIWQTGSTRRALRQRKGNLTWGVLLILFGVVSLAVQLTTLLK
jgi:hypothetical protein